jgi:calcineurin-like phosphoesterase family protein
MNIWFTSDTHFGHANIIKYCNRPFKSLEEMNRRLIHNWNQRVKEDDMVFHLGDFCFRNTSDKGEGIKVNAVDWMKKLNGNIVLIKGNHDKNNSAKSPIKSMVLEYDNKKILLIHDPEDFFKTIKGKFDIVLCGHIHDEWVTKRCNGVDIINAGVDVNNFMPVTFQELLKHREKQNVKNGL